MHGVTVKVTCMLLTVNSVLLQVLWEGRWC